MLAIKWTLVEVKCARAHFAFWVKNTALHKLYDVFMKKLEILLVKIRGCNMYTTHTGTSCKMYSFAIARGSPPLKTVPRPGRAFTSQVEHLRAPPASHLLFNGRRTKTRRVLALWTNKIFVYDNFRYTRCRHAADTLTCAAESRFLLGRFVSRRRNVSVSWIWNGNISPAIFKLFWWFTPIQCTRVAQKVEMYHVASDITNQHFSLHEKSYYISKSKSQFSLIHTHAPVVVRTTRELSTIYNVFTRLRAPTQFTRLTKSRFSWIVQLLWITLLNWTY